MSTAISTTDDPVSRVAQFAADRDAKIEADYEALIDRLGSGEQVPDQQLDSILRDAERKPDDLKRDLQLRADRKRWAKDYARKPGLEKKHTATSANLEALVIQFNERRAILENELSDVDEQLESCAASESRLLKTIPNYQRAEREKLDRQLSRAKTILAKKIGPDIPGCSTTARHNRARRREELKAQQADAELVVQRLQPLRDALGELAFKAVPSRSDVAAVLATQPSESVVELADDDERFDDANEHPGRSHAHAGASVDDDEQFDDDFDNEGDDE